MVGVLWRKVMIWQAILLFIAGFLTDFTWVFYVRYVNAKKRFLAAWWSVGTGICTLIFVETVVGNFYGGLFWLTGLWFGTFFSDNIESFAKKIIDGRRNRKRKDKAGRI